MNFKHLSVLGSNLLEPAFDLINILQRANPSPPNRMQSSIIEHTYSASIILLCATAIESSIRRLQFFNRDETWIALHYAKNAFSDYPDLDHLDELFTVRDSIAHNHLWMSTIVLTPPDSVQMKKTKRLPGFGDKRYESILNRRTKKTKALKLNLRPTSLCRSDVSTVLEVTSAFLFYLETKDPVHANIVSGRYYMLGSKHRKLSDAVDIIGRKWRTASVHRRTRTHNKQNSDAL